MKMTKRIMSMLMAVIMILSCWVWIAPEQSIASAANDTLKDHYLFAYFTGTSQEGQTIHLAVSSDGLNYTALRNNEPVIIPSKGVGCVRDPYIWYNEQDNYYYILATDLDFTDDGDGDGYSENSQSFIVWRSKDLVHWYDETMIDVHAMSHIIGDTSNMIQVWAPQVLWDGESYVVYFSLRCAQTGYDAGDTWNNIQIVYLRTTDLLDKNAYYEYGVLFDPHYSVIDADIIQNPDTQQWYLFFKNEDNDLGTNDSGTALKTIHYAISEGGPLGPYTIGATASNNYRNRIYPSYNINLEGCNSFFDNNGDLITFTDNYVNDVSTFYVSKSSDFSTFTMLDSSTFNLNAVSPRHGSVVKITEAEYNNLLNNAYGITSSSFPATEELSDHLVGRYFTTADPTYNAANGKNDLSVTNITMANDYLPEQLGYYAFFDGSTSAAEIDLENIISGDLNYDDGFTITFTSLVYDSPSNARFYEIADTFGSRTGTEHYTHFACNADSNGAYIGNYNGPSVADTNVDSSYWISLYENYDDATLHEFIVSYANGNIILYVDGELVMKKNRFINAAYNGEMDDSWYKAIGNGTLLIGKSGWSGDPLVYGGISDFCIYDCSMSYYDVQTIQNEQDIEAGLSPDVSTISSLGTAIPSWTHSSTDQMASLAGTYFSNVLYSPQLTGMPSGNGSESCNPTTANGAAVAFSDNGVHVGIYYAKTTVLYLDGINTPKIPVYAAGRLDNARDSKLTQIYPIVHQLNDTSDCKIFSLTDYWKGWNASSVYHESINNPDGITTGYNSSTTGVCDLDDTKSSGQDSRDIYYIANVLQLNENEVMINDNGYQLVNLSWHITYDWQEYKYIFPAYQWDDWQTGRTQNLYSGFNPIYIVDLKDFVSTYNAMAAEYDSIVTNTSYCPAAIANYKAIVEEMKKFDPQSYDYASGTEAAVAACYAQSQKLIADYNTVKAQLGPCNNTTLAAKAPTCTANGVTEGTYCSICGETKVEQKPVTKLPHSFGEQFTEDGVNYYVQCSICGLKYLVENKEVRYENLFALDKWAASTSFSVPNNSTVDVDLIKDTITVVNTAASGEGYTGASGNVSRTLTHYAIPVKGGQTYVLEYMLTSTGVSTDVFIFYYDKDNNHVGTYGGVCSGGKSASQVYSYQFTTHSDAAYMELRFDSNDAGKTAKFANVGVYTKENYDLYSSQNPYSRLRFSTEESIELFTPKRIGYEFMGWYTSDGRKIENTNQLPASTTVFAEWRELGNSVNYNGNLFSLTDFASTNDYKVQGNMHDGHAWTDFNTGTFYTLSPRTGLIDADITESLALDMYNQPGSYKVPVTGGAEYVFTMTLSDTSAKQCYLWFYDANGNGVTHPASNAVYIGLGHNKPANGSSISWEGNTLEFRFTVPDGATQMSFRLGTTGKYAFTQAFSNIGLYSAEDYEIYKQMSDCPATTYVPNSETTALATPTRDCFEFAGWNTGKFGTGTDFTSASTASMTADKKVYPKWKITDAALTEDSVVIDFGSPITFNPIENDTVANDEATFTGGNYKLVSVDSTDAQGTFSVNGNTVTYNPASAINGSEYVSYNATLSAYGMETTVSGTLIVVPASNILYEEDVFTESSALTGNAWSETNSSATTGNQANSSADDVYGYDTSYLGNAGSFSGNNALTTTVDSTSKRSKIMTYSFLGTGFDLYGQCGPDSGVMIVTVKDSSGKAIKASIVDTYYNDDSFGTLTQVPITGASDLPYDTYTVQVAAMYLASAGAVQATQAQAVMGFRDMVAYSAPVSGAQMLYEALAEVGMEDVYEADDLEVIWFDEGSVFNSGFGASTYAVTKTDSTSTTSTATTLTCVIDSIRVYNPAYYVGDEYYISSEQGAQYYNIMNNLKNGDVVSGSGSFANVYTPDNDNATVEFNTYEPKGSNEEFYLTSGTNALTFTVAKPTEESKVMVSFRAAYGTPTVKIGSAQDTIESGTEMYYDITDYIAEDGTVTIQNITDGTLLAVGSVKVTGAPAVAMMSTFNLRTARTMMMAESEEVDLNAPEEIPSEPEVDDVPSTDEEITPDTESSTDADSAINGLLEFINKLIDFILKIIRTVVTICTI